MSQENVDTVRRVYERWERDREIDPTEFDPEFEIRTPIMELENRRHRGYEGYKAWRAANADIATDNWFEVAEFSDLGDRVLVTGWIHLTGKGSGLETREPAVQLWTFTDGKPSSMTAARSLEEAMRAAGLETTTSAVDARDVQRIVDAWNRRDLDALLAIASPEIEYVNSPLAVEPGTRRGRDQYASVLRAQWDFVGDARLEIRSLETSGDTALLMLEMARTLQGSETPVRAQIAMRITYRDGQMIRQELFPAESAPRIR